MREQNLREEVATVRSQAPARSARRMTLSLALLLGLVVSVASGCIFVPVGGWGYHEHHGGGRDRGHWR
jgi:hypothetical protein